MQGSAPAPPGAAILNGHYFGNEGRGHGADERSVAGLEADIGADPYAAAAGFHDEKVAAVRLRAVGHRSLAIPRPARGRG